MPDKYTMNDVYDLDRSPCIGHAHVVNGLRILEATATRTMSTRDLMSDRLLDGGRARQRLEQSMRGELAHAIAQGLVLTIEQDRLAELMRFHGRVVLAHPEDIGVHLRRHYAGTDNWMQTP